MNELIRRLLDEMDAELSKGAKPGERLDLYHIGRSVLIFHYGAKGLSTRDFDIVWLNDSVLEERAENFLVRAVPKRTKSAFI
jgi:hypothetical protein